MQKSWIVLSVILLVVGFLIFTGGPTSAQPLPAPTPTVTTRLASPEELAKARSEWQQSKHAETFDEGMGANTTCARCKSPLNYDPSQSLAAEMALNCNACKRIPGQSRPELASGVQVSAADWHNITCEVCHIPVGDTYDVGISFWDQQAGAYRAMESVSELCAQCHEGQHGFEVVEEQRTSQVHATIECTGCHGYHGAPSACTDCHDPTSGPGAFEHARHPNTNCTACHDAGGLSIWYEQDPASVHYGQYVTRRFAHTLTSWPSHNLSREVSCVRCHHPLTTNATVKPALASEVPCEACHQHQDGAVLTWCTFFERNPDLHQSNTVITPQP